MELKIFGTTWGSELSLADTLFRIKDAGYDGVEMLLPESATAQHQLRQELHKLDLRLIAMQIPFSNRGKDNFPKLRVHLTLFAPLSHCL